MKLQLRYLAISLVALISITTNLLLLVEYFNISPTSKKYAWALLGLLVVLTLWCFLCLWRFERQALRAHEYEKVLSPNDRKVNTNSMIEENAVSDRIQEDNINSLSSDIAHELRTPLTILQAQLEGMIDNLIEPNEAHLMVLLEECKRLTKVVNDIQKINFSHLGVLDVQKKLVNPIEILNMAIKSMLPSFEKTSLAVSFTIPKTPKVEVFANEQQILRMFLDVLDNSCRYTLDGGKVNIEARFCDNHILFKIEDSSPGVPEGSINKLFQVFYRLELSRNRKFGGAGLGLCSCKATIRAHEGKIWAKNSPLGGLAIFISLPIKDNLTTKI